MAEAKITTKKIEKVVEVEEEVYVITLNKEELDWVACVLGNVAGNSAMNNGIFSRLVDDAGANYRAHNFKAVTVVRYSDEQA